MSRFPENINYSRCYRPNLKTRGIPEMFRIFLVMLAAVIMQGCSARIQQPVMMTQPGMPPQPAPSVSRAMPKYVIHPGDELEIKFFYNKELNEDVVVRPDGRISLQLVHDVMAAGLFPSELVKVLTEKYDSYLSNPELTVIVKKFEAQKVYVDGEVQKPGVVKIDGYLNVLQAIAMAGGMKDTAIEDEILVIRHSGLAKPSVLKVDMEKVLEGSDTSQNITLQAYDIVYVPKSVIANVNTWVDLYIRKNIPINFSFAVYKPVF